MKPSHKPEKKTRHSLQRVLEWDVMRMLTFNLTVTREEKFSVQKKGKFSLSSYDIAAHVIELFYLQKEQASCC